MVTKDNKLNDNVNNQLPATANKKYTLNNKKERIVKTECI